MEKTISIGPEILKLVDQRIAANDAENKFTCFEVEEALREHGKEIREEERERFRRVWLDVQFLDKYSEDEEYWISEMKSNHCVEMHISDFERLKALTTPEPKE